nr:TRAP transporter small permease [uncultured Jannaschia sp.]
MHFDLHARGRRMERIKPFRDLRRGRKRRVPDNDVTARAFGVAARGPDGAFELATASRASSRKVRPASVTVTPVPDRSKIGKPRSVSASLTLFEIAGCATFSISAARRNPPESATAIAYLRCLTSRRDGFMRESVFQAISFRDQAIMKRYLSTRRPSGRFAEAAAPAAPAAGGNMLGLFQRTTAALMLLGGVGVVLMMLNIVADVASKLLWNAPIQGTVEVSSYYYMILLVMLPMAFVEMQDEQISVDLLFDRFPEIVQRALLVLTGLAAAAILSVMAWRTGLDAIRAIRVSEVVMGSREVVVWPARMVLPLGFGLAALASLLRAVLALRGQTTVRRTDTGGAS